MPKCDPKSAFFRGGPGSHLMHGTLDSRVHSPKRHLDRFIRFCTTHARDQQADIQTRCMCNNKPHLTLCIAMWPKSILQLNIATSCCITDSESRIAAGTYRIRLRISTTRWIFPVRYSGPVDGLFPWGMWAPPTGSWTHPSPHPKWHFDRFIQYTDHAVTSVTNK